MDSWDWHCGHTREKKRPRPIHKKFHSGFHYHAIHSGLGEHDPTIQVLNIPANQHNPEPPHTNIKPVMLRLPLVLHIVVSVLGKYILKPQPLKVTHKSHHSVQPTHLPLITSSTCSTLTPALTYLLSVPRSPSSARPSASHPFPACHAPSFIPAHDSLTPPFRSATPDSPLPRHQPSSKPFWFQYITLFCSTLLCALGANLCF